MLLVKSAEGRWKRASSVLRWEHRVDRVLGLFSRRPNWDSHTPSTAGECVFPPFGSGVGGYTHSLGGKGVGGGGVPIPSRGQTLWYSRYICTLWAEVNLLRGCRDILWITSLCFPSQGSDPTAWPGCKNMSRKAELGWTYRVYKATGLLSYWDVTSLYLYAPVSVCIMTMYWKRILYIQEVETLGEGSVKERTQNYYIYWQKLRRRGARGSFVQLYFQIGCLQTQPPNKNRKFNTCTSLWRDLVVRNRNRK
jgi:hypothetical protein